MTQETEATALELAMVSCAGCDLMFIASERRQSCPTCGGEAAGPYFEFVLDGDGLHPKEKAWTPLISREEAIQELKDLGFSEEVAEIRVAGWDRRKAPAPEAPAAATPVEEAVPAEEGIKLPPSDVLPLAIESYLRGGEATEDDLRDLLTDLGVEREAAVTAVGRLVAVRDLIRELTEGGVEAQVEAEVEGSPEAAPEPSPAGEDGSETP